MEERNTSGPIPWEEPDNREEQDAVHLAWKDGLNQLGFHIEFDEESNTWAASRNHDNAKIIVFSGNRVTLANEIILSYQALLMHATTELTRLRSELSKLNEFISTSEQFNATQGQSYRNTIEKLKFELQQERELRKELVEGLNGFRLYYQRTQFPYKTKYEKELINEVEELIKKAKLNN